jgi:hypothetical protein
MRASTSLKGPAAEARERIERHLDRLGLKGFSIDAYLAWVKEHEPSDLEAAEQLLAAAAAIKRERSIEWRIKGSGLKIRKTMAAFDWDFQPKLDRRFVEELLALSFVQRHEDLLITGKSGTGKSHILQALAVKACEQEWMVRYARCVDLVDHLYAGLADGSYERRMKSWCRPTLLVIDDVGLGQLKLLSAPLGLRPRQPGVEPCPRDVEHLAELADWEMGLLRVDEREPHLLSSEEGRRFFRMSRSILSSRTSFRSCANSSRSAVVKTPGRPFPASARARSTQTLNAEGVRSRSCDT